ncbi:MAG: tetratricopeptide repeat protein [Bryobacteraceae bacterium]|nr:tetratricopeptide repeat protein [Bryobacteraceae bacterium]MDW8378485.1 tetratricopeptide repeat protein [Bryobacterales bacterium]
MPLRKLVAGSFLWLLSVSLALAWKGHAQTTDAPTSATALRASATPEAPTPVRAEKPATVISPEMRGDIYMARKMYREAIEAYRQGPKDSPVLENKIGIAYHQMMMLDEARKQYEKAIKLNPKYSEAINNLGTIYYAKKSYRRAVNAYKKALQISPNAASVYSNLGTAYFARKKYEDALKAYQRALELDPEVFEHRSSNGVLLQERSIAERAKFHFYLSKTYAKAGNIERALLYMRKAIEEGFKDRHKFVEDPEFASIREHPEFEVLLKMENRVL